MKSLEEKIAEDKKRYFDFIKQNQGKSLYIYGAGRKAIPLYEFLKKKGITIKAFCVSDKKTNKKEEYNLPIIELRDVIEEKEDVAFLLGVDSKLNDEIIGVLEARGYKTYLRSTEYLRYYGEFQNYFFNNPLLEITTKIGCEVNCKYCPQEVFLKEYFKGDGTAKMMSFETFKLCVDKMPKNALIEFAGFTEPFFNPQCTDMILYAHNQGYRVSLFTTLRGMNLEIFEKIKHVYFEEFVLHIPDEEGYSDIPITSEYLLLLDELVKAKKPNGDDYIDYASGQGTTPKIIEEHLGNSIRIFTTLHDRAGNLSADKLHSKKNVKGSIRCELAKTINHNILLPDGRVILCSMDFGLKHILGNLVDSTYEEIMRGAEVKRVLSCMKDTSDDSILCRQCCFAALDSI